MVVIIYCYIGCQDKATTWYSNGLPDGSTTLGQQYNVGENPTVILYTYINRHAEPPIIPQHNKHKNNSVIEPYNNRDMGQKKNVGERPIVILYNSYWHT